MSFLSTKLNNKLNNKKKIYEKCLSSQIKNLDGQKPEIHSEELEKNFARAISVNARSLIKINTYMYMSVWRGNISNSSILSRYKASMKTDVEC